MTNEGAILGATSPQTDGYVGKAVRTLEGRAPVMGKATLGRAKITTIEGLTKDDGTLSDIKQAFWEEAGLHCAFCAPGMLMCTAELLESNPDPTDEDIDSALSDNLYRCTGYQSIRRAVRAAVAKS